MGKTSLPPGFRFHPTDEELVMFYLKRKVTGKKLPPEVISVLDIYQFVPEDLPDKSCLKSRDLEWYFFCPRIRKYSSGGRANRTTESGYWKTTGNDRKVEYNNRTVGQIRTLIFHLGRAPRGDRTDWVMHEYRLEDKDLADRGFAQDELVLCKIFQKSGLGPKNGAQYGAPFNEEEWDSGDEGDQIEYLPVSCSSAPAIVPSDNQSNSILIGVVGHGDTLSEFPSSSGPSETLPSADQVLPSVPDNDNPELQPDDEFLSMFKVFQDDDIFFFNENDEYEVHEPSQAQIVDEAIPVEGNDIFKDLIDLDNPAEMNKFGINFSSSDNASLYQWLLSDSFLELHDLDLPLNISAEGSGSRFDLPGGVCIGYDTCNDAEHFDHQSVDFGVMLHASASIPYTAVLEDGSCGFENQKDEFLEKCVQENVKQGYPRYECASYNKKRPEPDSGHEAHAQKRGKEQTKSHSRLRHLIESIPSQPASAAEHPGSGSSNGLRENAMTVLCPSVGVGRYTEEGHSDNLGYCGCSNLYRRRRELRKEPAAAALAFWDGNLIFILFLGLLSAFMWVFIAAIIMKLSRFAWDLLFT